MKIIDFERKGNVVRFYLGEETEEQGWTNPDYKDYTGKTPDWLKPSDNYYGDHWDSAPYEHNAGRVYPEFVKGHKDIAFDFDDVILEPADLGYSLTKEEIAIRPDVPCIIVVPKKVLEENNLEEWQLYSYTLAAISKLKGIKGYYLGDKI